MIKKIVLLALAATIAASSAASAATKKIQVTNEAGAGVYYKVGKTVKYVAAGSKKSFPLPAKAKTIKIQASTAKTGGFRTVASVSRIDAKAAPFIQVNPVSGRSTDLSN
jgi:hypothetical protein